MHPGSRAAESCRCSRAHPLPDLPTLPCVLQAPSGGGGGGGTMHAAEAVFTFGRLQFGQPSQMRPRWLVFAGSLLGG